MKRASSYWWIFALFAVVVVLGIMAQRNSQPESKLPRARFEDKTPLGGKGLHLLLDSQGFKTKLQSDSMKAIPNDAKVWLLLDPQAKLSNNDTKVLLQWVNNGGLLIWSNLQSGGQSSDWWKLGAAKSKGESLRQQLKVSETYIDSHFIDPDKSLLPVLEP
ncbi:MAG: hypothetical protein ABIR03_11645, partial [Ginsengibacter sp.]